MIDTHYSIIVKVSPVIDEVFDPVHGVLWTLIAFLAVPACNLEAPTLEAKLDFVREVFALVVESDEHLACSECLRQRRVAVGASSVEYRTYRGVHCPEELVGLQILRQIRLRYNGALAENVTGRVDRAGKHDSR